MVKKNSTTCGGLLGPFGPPSENFFYKTPHPKPKNATFIAKMGLKTNLWSLFSPKIRIA